MLSSHKTSVINDSDFSWEVLNDLIKSPSVDVSWGKKALGNAAIVIPSPFSDEWCQCELKIWWMTLENNLASLLYYIKLCTSFQSHQWIETGVTARKRSIRVKISNFLSRVTLKFDRWPWKTIGHLFYAASSLMHHFIAISEFKLELQSGNVPIWVKIDVLLSYVTLNNRAPLLCYFKLCASFSSHWWNQTGVIVRKRPISVKIENFLSHVTLKWKIKYDAFSTC